MTQKCGLRGKRVLVGAVILAVAMLSGAVLLCLPHVRFWMRFEAIGRNPEGLPEYRHRDTGIVFVLLPGGTFWMGSPNDEEGRETSEAGVPNKDEDAEHLHAVSLSPYLLGKFELRQSEWEGVMGGFPEPQVRHGANVPVAWVSWEEAQDFCVKTGLRLPTEAQWEFGCRAGCVGPFSGTGRLDDMGWYRENSGGTIHDVGTKSSNQYGLHDMHGNLFEWCEDIHDFGFYSTPAASELDPVCELCSWGSDWRVVRGGFRGSRAWDCRCAARAKCPPDRAYGHMGLRVAYYPMP
jgi:formylglycine-generating enzyme required for sulfatase activity